MPSARYRFIVGVLGGLLAVAACNSAAPASGSPAASLAVSPSASPSAIPSPLPTASPPAASAGATSPRPAGSPGAGSDLAALIPDEIAGSRISKTVYAGTDLGDLSPTERAVFEGILEATGSSPEALTAVAANGGGVNVVAIRVEGADGAAIADSFVATFMSQLGGGEPEIDDLRISGKDVRRVDAPGISSPFYMYLSDDILFIVGAETEALLGEIFAALP